jgi:hypothetical protein
LYTCCFFLLYIGIGSDPNYGSFIVKPNRPGEGIFSISYDPSSSLYSELINPTHQNQQQFQQSSIYNYNNAWQGSNTYYNPFYNRYPPGSQGWYAIGGNYWYNNSQSIIAHPCLLIISILILFFCK